MGIQLLENKRKLFHASAGVFISLP